MGFKMKATSTGGDFEPAPEGAHSAICTRLIDQGTEHHAQFGDRRRVQIGFEIDELREDGERYMVFSRMTLSMHEKSNLRKFLESWRGRAYQEDEDVDITSIVGRPGLVNVVHNVTEQGKTYANIASVSSLPKGMTPITPKGETICLSLDPDAFSDAEFEKLHEKARERLQQTPEWAALTAKSYEPVGTAAITEDNLDDDIPEW